MKTDADKMKLASVCSDRTGTPCFIRRPRMEPPAVRSGYSRRSFTIATRPSRFR